MIKHGFKKKLVWQSICFTLMNSHARRCTLKLKRRNCFLIYIYYNLSLKTYIITFSFFFSFFLYHSSLFSFFLLLFLFE